MTAIIKERLTKYPIQTLEDENSALKEILQEIILYALSEAGFFEYALFQGGTALRIFYGLNRFSEDLDFILKKPNDKFNWRLFFKAIETTCSEFGIVPEILDKGKQGVSVQKMLLKDNSIVKIINLTFPRHYEHKFRIKLEIDINPPLGSVPEIKFLDFPLAAAVETQDLSSNFSGKCHALLCRKYIKGRDWYDFLWYISKGIGPNFFLLTNAINQLGPWAQQNISVSKEWLCSALSEKICQIAWQQAAEDVAPFLNTLERKSLKVWCQEFFLDRVNKLKAYLS